MFLNRWDTNPKLILTFRDSNGNLVPGNRTSIASNYSFDLVLPTSDTVILAGNWFFFNTFNFLQFCPNESRSVPCLSNITAARFRLQSFTGATLVSKQYIPVTFIDNYGIFFNSDNISNSISPLDSYLRMLNQELHQ